MSDGATPILVAANETVLGKALLDRVRARTRTGPSVYHVVVERAEARV